MNAHPTTRERCPMMSRPETLDAISKIRRDLRAATEALDSLLTWGELDEQEREQHTRAANAAELASLRAAAHGHEHAARRLV